MKPEEKILDISFGSLERGNWILDHPLQLVALPCQGSVLRGPNGSGKTSLLMVLAGLLPFRGHVICRPLPEHTRLKLTNLDGLEDITVYQHLKFWQAVYGASRHALDARIDYYELWPYADILLRHLSYGWCQRLAFARLGLGESHLWLLDEPFAGLDEASGILLAQDLAHTLQAGKAIMMACHHNSVGWPEIHLR